MKAYGNNGAAITWSNGGGILHGTWESQSEISTSDRTLKENIQNLDETLQEDGRPANVLRELRPVSFKYKGTSKESERTRFVFIAQEVSESLPEIARTLPRGTGYDELGAGEERQGLVYQDLLAVLTAMLQGLTKEMSVLTPRLASIEERIAQRKRLKRSRRKNAPSATGASSSGGTVPPGPRRSNDVVV